MKNYGKVWESGNVETMLIDPTNEAHLARVAEMGYLPIDRENRVDGTIELGELDSIESRYVVGQDRILLVRERVVNSAAKVASRIEALKAELAASDYKVVKSQEQLLIGGEVSYDMAAVHLERESLREQIRGLEGLEPIRCNDLV